MAWDRKLYKERNQKAVRLVLDAGYKPSEVAWRFGVNAKEIYSWVNREKQRRKLKDEEAMGGANA